MILIFKNSLGRTSLFLSLFLFSLMSVSVVSVCYAATENYSTGSTCSDGVDNDGNGYTDAADPKCDNEVDKQNLVVNVSTTDTGNWYNESDKTLHTFAVCDNNPGASYGYSPCNTDGIHDDYYSTDTPNEVNVVPAEKKFTIRVDAADAFGIDKIQIEWLNVTGTPSPQSWTASSVKKSSFTCSGSGSCVICTNGGGCDNAVIDPSFLTIPSGKEQQRFFFRVTVVDNHSNSVTTGFDDDTKNLPVLDKFYRFVICGSDCHSCNPVNNPPKAILEGYDEVDSFCEGLKYRLRWIFLDEDNDKQAFYSVEVKEKGEEGPVYAVSRQSSDAFFNISNGVFSNGNIDYDKTYEWRVKVSDDDDRSLCRGTSEWSAWSDVTTSFTTPLHPYPKVSFAINNTNGNSCDSGACSFLEDIIFSDTSTIYSSKGATYKWYIDDSKYASVYSMDKDTSRKFLEAEQGDHAIRLVVIDSDGYSCAVDKNLLLKKSNATWNEVVPR